MMETKNQHIKRCLFLSPNLTDKELRALYETLYLNEKCYIDTDYPVEVCYPNRESRLLFRFVFWENWHIRAVLKTISDRMVTPLYLDFENDCIQ